MKNLKLILIGVVVAAAACNTKNQETSNSTEQQHDQTKRRYAILDSLDKRVIIEEIPATNVLSLGFSGNYKNHPEAYAQLSGYANKNYANAGGIIGIYPQDPDLVDDESNLVWEITLRVLPGKPGPIKSSSNAGHPFETNIPERDLSVPLSELKTPDKPFALKTLPATQAVTLISDVAHIAQDGLAMNAWIDLNNYVQTGITRTEFGSAEKKSMEIPVKIIVPVKRRTRETI